MKKWIWSCTILICLIFILGNVYLYQKYNDEMYSVTKVEGFVKPQKSDIRNSTMKDGVVTTTDEQVIAYNPEFGLLDEVLVKEGDTVGKGTVLIQYKTDEYDRLKQQTEMKIDRTIAEADKVRKDITALGSIRIPTTFETEIEEAEAKANEIIIDSQIRELELKEELLELDIKEYDSQIEAIEAKEESNVTLSPINGIVKEVNSNNLKELVTIISNPYVVQGELSEQDIKTIEIGQKVYVSLDNKKLVGTISEISPYPVDPPSLDQETSYFPFTVSVTEEEQLAFGHHLRLEIVRAESVDATLVSTNTMVEKAGKEGRLYLAENGRLKETKVTLGLREKQKVEVTNELELDALLLRNPSKDIKDGSHFVMPLKGFEFITADLKSISKRDSATIILKAFVGKGND
ncbi:efflux RND transporter periplasmic adaptor subunit [Bacillus sp. DJP31]|uniref:efflux RND transporter periplasmic adaptor subunit n=1 Tax=Bacillus sp. DJP31 TaxID=3409789 RepID=UPI003BB7FB25